jgi:hypothetical protein
VHAFVAAHELNIRESAVLILLDGGRHPMMGRREP